MMFYDDSENGEGDTTANTTTGETSEYSQDTYNQYGTDGYGQQSVYSEDTSQYYDPNQYNQQQYYDPYGGQQNDQSTETWTGNGY